MAELRACPQDCKKCGYPQHMYCAAQMAFQMSGLMAQMQEQIEALAADVKTIKASYESDLIDLYVQDGKDAQKGSGADKDSQDKLKN